MFRIITLSILIICLSIFSREPFPKFKSLTPGEIRKAEKHDLLRWSYGVSDKMLAVRYRIHHGSTLYDTVSALYLQVKQNISNLDSIPENKDLKHQLNSFLYKPAYGNGIDDDPENYLSYSVWLLHLLQKYKGNKDDSKLIEECKRNTRWIIESYMAKHSMSPINLKKSALVKRLLGEIVLYRFEKDNYYEIATIEKLFIKIALEASPDNEKLQALKFLYSSVKKPSIVLKELNMHTTIKMIRAMKKDTLKSFIKKVSSINDLTPSFRGALAYALYLVGEKELSYKHFLKYYENRKTDRSLIETYDEFNSKYISLMKLNQDDKRLLTFANTYPNFFYSSHIFKYSRKKYSMNEYLLPSAERVGDPKEIIKYLNRYSNVGDSIGSEHQLKFSWYSLLVGENKIVREIASNAKENAPKSDILYLSWIYANAGHASLANRMKDEAIEWYSNWLYSYENIRKTLYKELGDERFSSNEALFDAEIQKIKKLGVTIIDEILTFDEISTAIEILKNNQPHDILEPFQISKPIIKNIDLNYPGVSETSDAIRQLSLVNSTNPDWDIEVRISYLKKLKAEKDRRYAEYSRKESEKRLNRVDRMVFIGVGVSSMHLVNLSIKTLVERQRLFYGTPFTWNIRAGLLGGSAGIGVTSEEDWLMLGLSASYLRTWSVFDSERNFDVENNKNGILFTIDAWLVFAALEMGIAVLPDTKRAAHFYIGFGGSFPF